MSQSNICALPTVANFIIFWANFYSLFRIRLYTPILSKNTIYCPIKQTYIENGIYFLWTKGFKKQMKEDLQG